MIKFFRIIRQNLLSEGKTRKYFKYAIGEIVLVVIGILIAVGINSMYYASQNEAKIKVILEQVQQDLATDIVDAKRIFNTLIEKDSLFQKIMNDSITFEMYKKNPYPLPINGNYVSFSNKKGGYERFMDNLENLPEKYNVLLPHFNNLYFEIQNEIDDYNMHIKNTVMIDGREEYKTNPKVAEYDMNWDSEESLEFYFKDPFLKNKSSLYINDLSNISWAANIYSVESIIVYKKIDSLLGKTQVDYKEPLALLPEKDMLNSSLGDYAGTADVFGQTLSLSFENENLILKNSNTPDAQLYWHEGDYFFIKEAKPIFKIYKNKKEQHTIEINYRGTCSKFIKTKDL